MNEKKKAILECFMRNINTWQRVNHVTEELHDYFFTPEGEYNPDGGRELCDYLSRLDREALAIEAEPRDYTRLNFIV